MSNKPLFSPILCDAVFPLVARLLITAIFVQGALGKSLGWSGQAAYVQSHQLPVKLIPTWIAIDRGIWSRQVVAEPGQQVIWRFSNN